MSRKYRPKQTLYLTLTLLSLILTGLVTYNSDLFQRINFTLASEDKIIFDEGTTETQTVDKANTRTSDSHIERVELTEFTGTRKLYVFLMNFSDPPFDSTFSKNVNPAQFKDRLLNGPRSMASYYNEQSFGKVKFDSKNTTVYGWYTFKDRINQKIPSSNYCASFSEDYDEQYGAQYMVEDVLDYYTQKEGIDFINRKDLDLLFIMDINCNLGYIPQMSHSLQLVATTKVFYDYPGSWNTDYGDTYLATRYTHATPWSPHDSHFMDCGMDQIGPYGDICQSGWNWQNYPDVFTLNSSVTFIINGKLVKPFYHLHPLEKYFLGWLNNFTEVDKSGSYELQSTETSHSTRPHMLIWKANGEYDPWDYSDTEKSYYVLTYRKGIGFDKQTIKFLGKTIKNKGLFVHTFTSTGDNLESVISQWAENEYFPFSLDLYDFKPESAVHEDRFAEEVLDSFDAPLVKGGQKFIDTYGGVTITREGMIENGDAVRVRVDFCDNDCPKSN